MDLEISGLGRHAIGNDDFLFLEKRMQAVEDFIGRRNFTIITSSGLPAYFDGVDSRSRPILHAADGPPASAVRRADIQVAASLPIHAERVDIAVGVVIPDEREWKGFRVEGLFTWLYPRRRSLTAGEQENQRR